MGTSTIAAAANLFRLWCCYMNVNLQLLMRDPIFSQVLERAATHFSHTTSFNTWNHMLRNCQRVIQGSTRLYAEGLLDALRSSQDSFLAVDGQGCKAMTQGQHCWADALEALLGAFFDSMPARERAILRQILTVPLQSFFTCGELQCQTSRCLGMPQPNLILHVPILAASTLEGNLEALFLGDKTSEAMECCKGEKKSDRVHGTMCTRISRPPPTLIINLKRATVDGSKCTKELDYPLDPDLTRFCAKHPATEGWGYDYKLGGGILHHGSGSGGGHYTFMQNFLGDRWIHRDDTRRTWIQNPLAYKKEIVGLVYHNVPTTSKRLSIDHMPPMLPDRNDIPDLSLYTVPTPLPTPPPLAIQQQLQLLEQQNQERMQAEAQKSAARAMLKGDRRAVASHRENFFAAVFEKQAEAKQREPESSTPVDQTQQQTPALSGSEPRADDIKRDCLVKAYRPPETSSETSVSTSDTLPKAMTLPKSSTVPQSTTLPQTITPTASTLAETSSLPEATAAPASTTVPLPACLPQAATLPETNTLPKTATVAAAKTGSMPTGDNKSNKEAAFKAANTSAHTHEEPRKKRKGGFFGRAVNGLRGFVRDHPAAAGAVLCIGGIAAAAMTGGRRGGAPRH